MHDPCCSAHGRTLSCAEYRRTHFVEVRPCCADDAVILRMEQSTCDGRCLMGSDLLPGGGNDVAIADPFCSKHGTPVWEGES